MDKSFMNINHVVVVKVKDDVAKFTYISGVEVTHSTESVKHIFDVLIARKYTILPKTKTDYILVNFGYMVSVDCNQGSVIARQMDGIKLDITGYYSEKTEARLRDGGFMEIEK